LDISILSALHPLKRECIRIVNDATRTQRLEGLLNPPLHPPGDPTAPGTEFLLQGREDPSPKSGVRTGLVLMALLAISSIFTVSIYSPGIHGDGLGLALWAAPAVALAMVLLLPRYL